MPRKSSAALAVLPYVAGRPSRIRPPSDLGEDESRLFRELVAACPEQHFVASDIPLLARYVEALTLAKEAADHLRADGAIAATSGRINPWLNVQEKSVRAVVALSARLRLAPQSRMESKTAGRQRSTASTYEVMEP